MNEQVVFVIPLIVQAVIAKRHIADGEIKEVIREFGVFVTGNLNVRVRVQLAGNASADAVQLHAGELTVFHALRQHTEEVADTHGRLQHLAALKTHLTERSIHCLDNDRRGVMRVKDRCACGLVFVLSEQTAQLLIAAVVGTERACHAAPADILREHLLFLGSRRTVCGFQTFQQADSRKVSVKFFTKCAGAEGIIRNAEVVGLDSNSLFLLRLAGNKSRIAFVLGKQLCEVVAVFKTGNRIKQRWVTQLDMKITNICDFKRLVIQINGITDLIRRRVRLEHIGGFGCGHILRVRLEHILRFRRTSCCFTQHRHNIIVSRILTKEIQQAAVTVTNILTLGECSAVRQQQRKFGFIVTGILVCFFISGIESIFQRTILFLDGFPTGNKILIRFSH